MTRLGVRDGRVSIAILFLSFLMPNGGGAYDFTSIPQRDLDLLSFEDRVALQKLMQKAESADDSQMKPMDFSFGELYEIEERLALKKLEHLSKSNFRMFQKMYDGTRVEVGQFAYAVSLATAAQDGEMINFCAGALVHERFVLTAAHCDQFPNSQIAVFVGSVELFASPGHFKTVRAFIKHNEYLAEFSDDGALLNSQNDIALVQLAEPVVDGKLIALSDSTPEAGPAEIAGWGWTHPTRGYPSPYLLKAAVQVRSQQDCFEIWGGTFRREEMICAKANHNYVCVGDSGGPLVIFEFTGQNVKAQQVGIVSFSPGNCGSEVENPAVYTNVAHFREWIAKKIAANP